MSFLFQSLLAVGLPLLALPLLIHLINLRRHRRVAWAAMDFLLESQKRNKKWIFLRQLLLLLLRTAVVASVVLMLAGPVLRSQWGRFFGQGTTHHLILLDDSYSMADSWERSNAFDEAKRVVSTVIDQASHQAHPQKLTLLRFSKVAELSAGAVPDIDQRTLDRTLFDEVESTLSNMQHSSSAAGPLETIHAALSLPEPSEDEARIVYLVSDFRRKQWSEENQLRQKLSELRGQSAQLVLVQCVEQTRPNLAITRLQPEAGIRAAGVETWFELSVANYGDQAARATPVTVLQDGHKLPAVVFDEIPANGEATLRFRSTFPNAGAHQLQATLERDAVGTDNVRYFACQVPATFPVLLIDGSVDRDDGYYLRTALNPGGSATPGWSPQVEPPSFLRKHDRLNEFAAICLLDVARLDEPEVVALEDYVRAGGGVAMFLGPNVQRSFYNERLYSDGEGMLPVLLDIPSQLLEDELSVKSDVVVSDHALFRVFGGQRNSFLAVARVNFYYATDPAWQLPAEGTTRILAHLRNRAPFVVEKQFGAGRVVVQMSKLSPRTTELGIWSNWSLNPVFPVYANELIGLLSSSRRQFEQHRVGQPIDFSLSQAEYEPEVRVRPPESQVGEIQTLFPRAEEDSYQINVGAGKASGVWKFELQPREGEPESRLVAVNIVPGEGDLHHADRAQLAQQLQGVDYEYSLASQMVAHDDRLAGFRLSDTLLYFLAVLLLIEQWLAYRASYHTRATAND